MLSAIALSIAIISCSPSKEVNNKRMKVTDKHSFAVPEEAVIQHLSWDAKVDFDQKIISATATYQLQLSENAGNLILDTKDLTINEVTNGNGESLSFSIGDYKEHLGKPLKIEITPSTTTVAISYVTSPEAEALQWLTPAQTAGKENPFLFTQSQAILARSWIPIQDSPGIRFTYDAKVEVPSHLLALMSAENPTSKNDSGIYTFKMNQKIPAYLMALAVGDIDFTEIGARTGVYAEPSELSKAAYEFGEMEQMLSSAEQLYGPYQWERYDLIVLPPSFPFGGMENPRLTFATPTILAGDRSLTSLVAHELAHSWSGNLVTNATWDDFWLNEGFTVYFEQRIMEALYGRDYSEMLASLSLQDLETEIKDMIDNGHSKDTHLKLDLTNRNPDDGMTSIAYDKGYNFLRMLEETVGREPFDKFLKGYFTTNAFSVMTTEGFVAYLKENLIEANNLNMDADFYESWIYKAGLPSSRPKPTSNKFDNVETALNEWLIDQNKDSMVAKFGSDAWSSHEWLHFVRNLPADIDTKQMELIDNSFGFTQSGNSEILAAWLIHVINHDYKPGHNRLEDFLVNTGRRKFLMPLYKELVKTSEGTERAKSIYEKARPNYHYVATSSIDELLSMSQ